MLLEHRHRAPEKVRAAPRIHFAKRCNSYKAVIAAKSGPIKWLHRAVKLHGGPWLPESPDG